jgi:uncharacterized membrane protein YqjE
MHPLIDIALSRPGLLMAHMGAYAELATVELEEAVVRHRRKMLVSAGMWFSGGLALMLLSMSFMFQMTLGHLLTGNKWWWMWLPASLPLLTSLACSVWLKTRREDIPFESLQQQLKQDAQWLKKLIDAA